MAGNIKPRTQKTRKTETIKLDRDIYYKTFPNWKKKAINNTVTEAIILLHKTIPEALIQEKVEFNPNIAELINEMLDAYITQRKTNN